MSNEISEKTKNFELTVLLPALNEIESIDKIIEEIKLELGKTEINYCILVSDNGSTDGTLDVAKKHNTIINHVKEKGYGSNLKTSIKLIKSKYIVFFDSDGSYDPKEIIPLYNEIKKTNYDMVYGNRLIKQEKKSMPLLNRYLGTPVLSKLISLFFGMSVQDCNSGMRMLKVSSFSDINFFCKGMEFASEMFIKSKFNNLKIKEIVINFRKDFRSGSPHLSRWRDGWRHLRYIIANAPDKFISSLAMIFLINYFIIFTLSFMNSENSFPRYHTIFSLLAINYLFQAFFLGIISMRIYLVNILSLESKIIFFLKNLKNRNTLMVLFLSFIFLSLLELIIVFFKWYLVEFGELAEINHMIRILVYSAMGSFFMYFDLQLESRE